MDAVTQWPAYPRKKRRERKPFLPLLAEAIALWFPELDKRSVAVCEVDVNKESVPTLPLVMVAFVRSSGNQSLRNHDDEFEIRDIFAIEFWLEPLRYKRGDGAELPFWTWYDYDYVRDTLLTNFTRWQAPNGEHISYRGMNIEADALAVTITLEFNAVFTWCPTDVDQGDEFKIAFCLKSPLDCCVLEAFDPCLS